MDRQHIIYTCPHSGIRVLLPEISNEDLERRWKQELEEFEIDPWGGIDGERLYRSPSQGPPRPQPDR
jgi:hypothetical protein